MDPRVILGVLLAVWLAVLVFVPIDEGREKVEPEKFYDLSGIESVLITGPDVDLHVNGSFKGIRYPKSASLKIFGKVMVLEKVVGKVILRGFKGRLRVKAVNLRMDGIGAFEELRVNGMNLDLSGTFTTKHLEVDGLKVSVSLALRNVENVEIFAMDLSGSLSLDIERRCEVEVLGGGKLDLRVPDERLVSVIGNVEIFEGGGLP